MWACHRHDHPADRQRLHQHAEGHVHGTPREEHSVTKSEGSSAAAVPAADTAPVLEVIGISKSYGSHEVLRDVSLTVRDGEVVCIIGPSDAGKSTFLRILNRLEEPDAGEVWGGGQPMELRGGKLHALSERKLSARRAKAAMAFWHFNLFPHLIVLGNVMEGPARVQRRWMQRVRAEAVGFLESVGLGDRVDVYPGWLSGGQRQRVAVTQTIAMTPLFLFFDEPTSALGPKLTGRYRA
jgi:polar amino acid transport system ATP-binding protein